jgi:uncharacterized protein (DUF1330 family)
VTRLKRVLATSSALGVAALAINGVHGQLRTSAYVITEIDVTDSAAFAEYAPKVQASFAPFGGRYVVRGGKTQSLAGDAPKRVVVLAFDSIDQARAWYASPDYEGLKALRDKAGKARIFAVEGLAQDK